MLLEGNAQQTFGLDHTLSSITLDRKFYAMQATMLPVGKPLRQNFQITQFRDLSGKDWMECNLLWPARLPPTRCASSPSESAVGASSVVEL